MMANTACTIEEYEKKNKSKIIYSSCRHGSYEFERHFKYIIIEYEAFPFKQTADVVVTVQVWGLNKYTHPASN